MRYTTFWIAVTLIIITATWTGMVRSQYSQVAPPVVPPEGWIIFDEGYLTHFQEEPEQQFHKARENFFKKEMKLAAADIRKAAAFLRLQAARATAEGKKDLMISIHELEKLANTVEEDTVNSVKKLDHAFAHSHHALAKHHYFKAVELWAEKNTKKAGHDLKVAAVHLEKSLIWFGERIESAFKGLIIETRLYAGLMIEGTGGGLKEVGKVLEKIGEEIGKVGKKIEPVEEEWRK